MIEALGCIIAWALIMAAIVGIPLWFQNRSLDDYYRMSTYRRKLYKKMQGPAKRYR